MPQVLIDSSIWIELLRRRTSTDPLQAKIEQLILRQRVATTGIIQLEVLRGTRTDEEFHALSAEFLAFTQLACEERHWIGAARLGATLRTVGLAPPGTDLLIAAIAIDHRVTLLHRGKHFDQIARHAPLRLAKIR